MKKREAPRFERRYVLYARGHRPPDEHTRQHVVIFDDPEHAKVWLTKFLGTQPHSRQGEFILFDDPNLKIKSEQLDEILAADDTSWQLPDQYNQWILQFKYGNWDEDHSSKDKTIEVVKDDGTTEIVKTPKVKAEPKPKREGKPDGYLTIGELCTKWNIKPLHARTCLRASDLVKPDYGWAFAPKDVPKIAKICGVKKP